MITMPEQDRPAGLERAAWLALLAFAASLQVSIFAAGVLLTLTAILWLTLVIRNRERIEVPRMFWPLAAYGAVTMLSAFNAVDRGVSLMDTKQLVLFAIIPIAYRLLPGRRSLTAVDVIITIGALEAIYGIIQYAILNFDHLQRRVQGSLSHYMTYSGVLMLVACAAAARLVFRKEGTHFFGGSRTWTVLVMPALIVALALTFTRSAWVGLVAGVGVLIVLKDRRLFAAIPLVVALTILVAPTGVTARMYSMFDVNDPSNKDRVAMLQSGVEIVRDHPLTGVGPDMVKSVYKEYRQPWAVNDLNVHLHNVPVHIAAERGLPALLIWLGFIVYLGRDLIRRVTTRRQPSLAAGGLAAVAAMLAAGLFEYNFGDSEFLMLFLVLITLPYASDRTADDADAR
jgi:O-antigen ligase